MAVRNFSCKFFPFQEKKCPQIAAKSEQTFKIAENKIHYIQLKDFNRIPVTKLKKKKIVKQKNIPNIA